MLYNVVLFLLYNRMNQLSYTYSSCLMRLPPTPSSHPSRLSHSTRLSSMYYIAISHQLSFVHIGLDICQCHALNSSYTHLPLLCPQVHSPHLCHFSCPLNSFLSTIPTFHVYALMYVNFLFLTYFAL